MIYILGNNKIAYYLATRFSIANKETYLLSIKNQTQSIKQITIKEESKFDRFDKDITFINHINKEPDFLIITAPLSELKAELTILRQSFLTNTKIICLSGIKSAKDIELIVKKEVEIGYFNGALIKKDDNITIIGPSPKILLSQEYKKDFLTLFNKAKINTETKKTTLSLFWSWFAPFAITFLLNSHYKKSVFDLLKNKTNRDLVEELAQNIVDTISNTQEEVEKAQIIADVCAISNQTISNFSFAKLNFIKETLNIPSSTKNELNKLIKTIYNNNVL